MRGGRGGAARRGLVSVAVAAVLAASTALGASSALGAGRRSAGPTAALALSPPRAFAGQLVVAHVYGTVVPAGTTVRRLTINWGDGSRVASLGGLASTPAHRYARPGRFVVSVTLVDSAGQSSRASRVELVAHAQRLYWDLFNGDGPQYQLESASLPLSARSATTAIPGTTGNKLQCTSGMAVDARSRLFVLGYPNGCSAPMSATIQVFALPVNTSSTPIFTLALPGLGDDDNLAFDHRGDLWVEDAYGNAVYEFRGPFASSTKLFPALTLTRGIRMPSGIAVDARGDLFVSNGTSAGARSIAVFRAPVTSAAAPTFLNGLQSPGGLIFDARGDLYASNNPSSGKGSALVRYNANHLGNGASPSIVDRAGVGGIHGRPHAANFAWDALGNLYLADCGNEASLKVYPLGTAAFGPRLSPSLVFTNHAITSLGCVWGIGVH